MKLKIFHGPHNIGGIGRYLADFQRKKEAISDFITWNDDTMRQNHHFNFQLSNYGVIRSFCQKIFFMMLSIARYNIYHFYFGKTFKK